MKKKYKKEWNKLYKKNRWWKKTKNTKNVVESYF